MKINAIFALYKSDIAGLNKTITRKLYHITIMAIIVIIIAFIKLSCEATY